MATQRFLGVAGLTAQVATATFATYDVTTTRKITIGGAVISALDSGGNLTAALAALATLLNTGTVSGIAHPYFTNITWTSSATQIIGTAKTAGAPFVFAGSASGGSGTCSNAYTVSTANSGPNDVSVAANWNTGSLPAGGDDVYIQAEAGNVNIAWGLAYFLTNSITFNSLTISKTYTGNLGLNTLAFTTDAAASTASTIAVPEYRQAYWQVSSTTPILIGEQESIIGTAAGSKRIMIDVGSTASQVIKVQGTGSTSADTGKPAVRLLANAATINVYVQSAPAGFGLAADHAGETSTIGNLYVSDPSTSTQVLTGRGVTMTLFEQIGGNNVIYAGATVPTINAKGGKLQLEGNWTSTTCNVYNGASVVSNQYGSPAFTTLNPYGGTIDFTQSSQPRTVTSTVFQKGGDAIVKADASIITFTGITLPSTKFSITAG